MRIEYYQDNGGQWRWIMKGNAGKIVAEDDAGYRSRTAVRRVIRTLVFTLDRAVEVHDLSREERDDDLSREAP